MATRRKLSKNKCASTISALLATAHPKSIRECSEDGCRDGLFDIRLLAGAGAATSVRMRNEPPRTIGAGVLQSRTGLDPHTNTQQARCQE